MLAYPYWLIYLLRSLATAVYSVTCTLFGLLLPGFVDQQIAARTVPRGVHVNKVNIIILTADQT
jgi:hypothetical protein